MNTYNERQDFFMEKLLDKVLKDALQKKASDIHFQEGICPYYRIDGKLIPTQWNIVDDTIFNELELNEKKEKDLSYKFCFNGQTYNCRMNFFHDLCGKSLAIRILPAIIPSIRDLNMPETFRELSTKEHGLIIVSGPTGSGKSTTIAAIINEINLNQERRIISLEDPIEYIHISKKSLISQREIGRDTKDFSTGLKYILREDPNVIVIGEMRDANSMAAALNAAESGHLVLTTLHAGTVIEAIERVPQYFSSQNTKRIYAQLANSLLAVVTQKLLPQEDGGRIAAFEILTNTIAAKNLIRTEQLHQIPGVSSFISIDAYIEELKLQKIIF